MSVFCVASQADVGAAAKPESEASLNRSISEGKSESEESLKENLLERARECVCACERERVSEWGVC